MQIIIAAIVIFLISLSIAGFSYWSIRRFKEEVKKKEEETRHRMYELAILKEVGDRIGYSLNLEKIVDIITGSLPQFIEYSAASYMLLEPEKILFKTELQTPVSKGFVTDVKKRMIDSLSALLGRDLSLDTIDEVVTGAIATGDGGGDEPVRSFFNIPLVIGGNVVGVLTVAHTKEGLYKEKEMTLLYKIVGEASQAVTRLEDVIKTERGKLGAMVESMTDGVIMTDNDYRVVVANPAAKRIAGIAEKKDATVFDFIDGFEGKFDIRGKLEESVKLGKVLAQDGIVIRGRVFQVFVSPVKGALGLRKEEVFGGAVVFHDVTSEKGVEKMREDFTSMMVHELRSPLDGIKKMGEMMRSDPSIREDKKVFDEYLGMMYKSSSSMLELVNDLLDVAKMESGKFDIRRRPTDIKQVIDERVRFFSALADDAKIALAAALGEGIPAEVDIDPVRIGQVFNNLISNALKFTGPGGRVTVQAFMHKEGGDIAREAEGAGVKWIWGNEGETLKGYHAALVVAVTDTGSGISKEHLGRLFNKFMQFEASATSGKKGTGLGLVISKGIIEAHGGTIGVSSEEGVGSTFYFTINA